MAHWQPHATRKRRKRRFGLRTMNSDIVGVGVMSMFACPGMEQA